MRKNAIFLQLIGNCKSRNSINVANIIAIIASAINNCESLLVSESFDYKGMITHSNY